MSSNPEDKLRAVTEHRRAEQGARERRYEEQSRRRLLRIIERKLSTSFIGALSKFEQFFGHLWGHGLDERELTDVQRRWREAWEECRNEVLNNGNNQVRAVRAELAQYTMSWDAYQTNMQVKQEEVSG